MGWAAFWFIAGAITFFPFLWLLSIASVACIAVPIGKGNTAKVVTHIPRRIPSSRFDKNFTDEEKDNYFGKERGR